MATSLPAKKARAAAQNERWGIREGWRPIGIKKKYLHKSKYWSPDKAPDMLALVLLEPGIPMSSSMTSLSPRLR